MTTEDAIKTMKYIDRNFGDYKPNHDAIEMAINALKTKHRQTGEKFCPHCGARIGGDQ